MGTRIVLAVCAIFVPALVLLFGILLRKCPPAVNGLFGYRTKRSMQNPQTWDFAQAYLAKLWIPLGAVTAAASAVVVVLFWKSEIDAFGKAVEVLTYAQIAVMLLTIPLTEHALKKKFDEKN